MDELYTYLGYTLIAVLLHLILKTLYEKSSSRPKEGFLGLFNTTSKPKKEEVDEELVKNMEENIKNVQNATSKTIEKMNLAKNRKYWEEVIIAMEDRIDSVSLESVATLASIIKTDPKNENVVKMVGNLNELSKYKETLKENMKYLDGLK